MKETVNNLLIVDDQTLFRKALIVLVEKLGISAKDAENGEKGLDILSREKFDVVITDIEMPIMGGYQFCVEIKKLYPTQKIIVLTRHNSVSHVKDFAELGVESYLVKNIEPDELELAIREVVRGKTYFPQDITAMLIQDLIVGPKKMKITQGLSERELEVLKMIVSEMTVSEIAQNLSVSPRTIENHKARMMEKLSVNNIVGLVRKAYEMNLM